VLGSDDEDDDHEEAKQGKRTANNVVDHTLGLAKTYRAARNSAQQTLNKDINNRNPPAEVLAWTWNTALQSYEDPSSQNAYKQAAQMRSNVLGDLSG
jgi:hypothetical protein